MIENHPYPPGRIAEIAVMQPIQPSGRADFARKFGGLLTAFPQPVRFYWLHPSETAFGTYEEGVHEIVSIPLGKDEWKDIWIQDPIHIGRNPTGESAEILVPVAAPDGDWKIARHLALAAGLPIRPARFKFEGGNWIQLGELLLAGKDMLEQNDVRNSNLEKDIVRDAHVQNVCWLGTKEPFAIEAFDFLGQGTTHQPFFHLDLFILPLGQTVSGKIQIGLGAIKPEFLIAIPPKAKDYLEKLVYALDVVHEQLSMLPNCPVEIVRIPMLLGMKSSFLHLYSHCNGYVDRRGNRRMAILPDYHPTRENPSIWLERFRELKDTVEHTLLGVGIQSHFVEGNFLHEANDCGALHCRTKVIRYKN